MMTWHRAQNNWQVIEQGQFLDALHQNWKFCEIYFWILPSIELWVYCLQYMCYHNVPKTINHRGYDLNDATTVQVIIYSQTLIVYYIGWLEINSYELSIFIIELWISIYQKWWSTFISSHRSPRRHIHGNTQHSVDIHCANDDTYTSYGNG